VLILSVMRLEPLGAGGQPGGLAAGNNIMVPLSPEQRKRKAPQFCTEVTVVSPSAKPCPLYGRICTGKAAPHRCAIIHRDRVSMRVRSREINLTQDDNIPTHMIRPRAFPSQRQSRNRLPCSHRAELLGHGIRDIDVLRDALSGSCGRNWLSSRPTAPSSSPSGCA
jgi:hypothetical protein